MADIIRFDQCAQEPDLDAMDREGLLDCLQTVRAQIEALDQQEPEDMDSEAYEVWGSRHEELEDLADEIWDRLDELEGPHG